MFVVEAVEGEPKVVSYPADDEYPHILLGSRVKGPGSFTSQISDCKIVLSRVSKVIEIRRA